MARRRYLSCLVLLTGMLPRSDHQSVGRSVGRSVLDGPGLNRTAMTLPRDFSLCCVWPSIQASVPGEGKLGRGDGIGALGEKVGSWPGSTQP
jgi:hypothetical protein